MIKSFRTVLILVCFLWGMALPVLGQEPFFKQIQVSSTASGLKINAICQDSRKMLWIGTSEGVFQYDGFVFRKIELPKSLAADNIISVAAFPTDGIIAGTKSGKIFSVIDDVVKLIQPEKFEIGTAISDICVAGKNEIWFSTFGEGLFRLNNTKWEHFTEANGLGDDYIYSILCDSVGRIWTGSDGGLSFSGIHEGKITFKNLDATDGLPDNIIRQLIKGPGNTIGIGMEEKGFCLFIPGQSVFSYPDVFKNWHYGPVTSIMMLENEFWIGTAKSGITDYEFKGDMRVRQFSENEGFDGINVSCMLKDHEGNIWIGANNELFFSPGERIEFKKSLGAFPLNNIRTILCDKNDHIWFSNDSTLYSYNQENNGDSRLLQPLTGTRFANLGIISMYEDIYGFLWMGTFDHGVLRYDPATGKTKLYTEADGLVNSSVLSIDGDGATIWFATLGGVSKCYLIDSTLSGATAFVSFSQENGLGNNFIYKVYIDNNKRVWFATDGKGITCFDNGKFSNFSENEGLKSKIIYSLTEDHSGNIWLSSAVDGLYRFDGKTFRNFSISQGLSDINITSLATDQKGNIIVVNKKGIDAIDPDNFQIISYGNEVGVSKIDPDVNVICSDHHGKIWIGTQRGIIKLSSEQKVGDKKPVLLLNKVLCFLENVDTTKVKEFAFDKNHISFDYSAIWYTDPQKISYQYRLEGYNNEWITTRDRFITFPNLRPGNYSFRLRTSINGNFTNSSIVTYDFKIQFPVWQRLWFIILCAVAFIVLFYFYLNYRDSRAKSLEILKKEKIESQFQILKNQVNPHFLFNSFNTLITVIEDDKNTAIEYVNKLSDFFRNILAYKDKDLITIKEELELVETYIFLQKKRYGKNFTVSLDLPEMIKDDCLIPPLALQILIENCLKHNAVSKETPLMVDVYVENHSFLVVKNNINPKLVKDPSTGIGLQNLKNRYMLTVKSEIVVIEDLNNFIVKLPLIHKYS